MARSPSGSSGKKSKPAKQDWTPPKVTHLGDLRKIVRGGGGKISGAAGDPGDSGKPKGQG